MSQENVLVFLMIYLAAMVIVVPIAKRLGLGSVIGYLLAGVLIGPYGFHLSENTKSIELLAELGIVLMLFTIGLEVNLNRLWGMRRLVIWFGLFQMIICSAAFSVASSYFGLSGNVSLILGVTLALSSTAVAIQLMKERQLLNAQVGKTVFSVLLLQDLAAIPLLVAVSVFYPSAEVKDFNIWYALLAIIGMIFIGKYFIRYGLRWVAQNGSKELFVAASLLLVILVTELMISVGVSAGLGAFLSGMLLASSEYRHQLEADLEPFQQLFLGLFFIMIGTDMDLYLIYENWKSIFGLLAVFMFLKMALLYFHAYLLKVPARERLFFTGFLGQGSEFAFVVVSLGIAGNMISKADGAWINIIVALSIGASPLIVRLFDYLADVIYVEDRNQAEEDRDMEHSQVIIAGFGRFGQIVGRLLLSGGVHSTVLDHDSEHIEDMRKFGFKVYYGDPTRIDMLEVAGAEKAKVLVIAIDDKEAILNIVKLAKKHFPHLKIVVRAMDVPHMYDVIKLDVAYVERELFEGSLRLGRAVLENLGFGKYQSKEMADNFRRTNIEQLMKFSKIRGSTDEKEFIKAVRQSREELERQLQEESKKVDNIYLWQDPDEEGEQTEKG